MRLLKYLSCTLFYKDLEKNLVLKWNLVVLREQNTRERIDRMQSHEKCSVVAGLKILENHKVEDLKTERTQTVSVSSNIKRVK